MQVFILQKSYLPSKKLQATDISTGKTIHFGAAGYSDFTLSKDKQKKANYIARHKPRENWTKTGIDTPGFWARHILWNKPTLEDSIKSTEKKFDIKILPF